MNKSKQYEIPKRAVIEAYKRVKANKGSAGIDGMDFEKFEERLNNNLYKIWNPPYTESKLIPFCNTGITHDSTPGRYLMIVNLAHELWATIG